MNEVAIAIGYWLTGWPEQTPGILCLQPACKPQNGRQATGVLVVDLHKQHQNQHDSRKLRLKDNATLVLGSAYCEV